MIKEYCLTDNIKKYLNIALLVIILPFLASRGARTLASVIKSPGLGVFEKGVSELSNYIKLNTQGSDVFYLHVQEDDQLQVSFYRALERARYADYKFVPAGTDKLYYWYSKILKSRELKQDTGLIKRYSQEDKIDYVISTKDLSIEGLTLVYRNEKYFLYQIN